MGVRAMPLLVCGVSANLENGRFYAWRQNRSEMAVLLFLTFWRARPATGRQPTDSDPSHDELDMAGRRARGDRR